MYCLIMTTVGLISPWYDTMARTGMPQHQQNDSSRDPDRNLLRFLLLPCPSLSKIQDPNHRPPVP